MPNPILQNKNSLNKWLMHNCIPTWYKYGIDQETMGFFEQLNQDISPNNTLRRTRVTARQIYSFCEAHKLGANIEPNLAIEIGMNWLESRTQNEDGFHYAVVAPDGEPTNTNFNPYDHAFILFSYACAFEYSNDIKYQHKAENLLLNLINKYSHSISGFEDSFPPTYPLKANPHMHLFEACLAWIDLGFEGQWLKTANMIAELAFNKFICEKTYVLREYFNKEWLPFEGDLGRIVEPGHLFEWAWLLKRWYIKTQNSKFDTIAKKLIEVAEKYGINDSGVCFNEIWDDYSPKDKNARLWPQTERIKAHAIYAKHAEEPAIKAIHLNKLNEAIEAMKLYFDTPNQGLYYDLMLENGEIVNAPAPASTLYHIVCAIAEINKI